MSLVYLEVLRTEAGVNNAVAVESVYDTHCTIGGRRRAKKITTVLLRWNLGTLAWDEVTAYNPTNTIVALRIDNICAGTHAYIQGVSQEDLQYFSDCCSFNPIPLKTFNGNKPAGYPVGVFDTAGTFLGFAANADQVVTLWNSSVLNTSTYGQIVRMLNDDFSFGLPVALGGAIGSYPVQITGTRYWQIEFKNSVEIWGGPNTKYYSPANAGLGQALIFNTLDNAIEEPAPVPPSPDDDNFDMMASMIGGLNGYNHLVVDASANFRTLYVFHNEDETHAGIRAVSNAAGTNFAGITTAVNVWYGLPNNMIARNVGGNFPERVKVIVWHIYNISTNNLYLGNLDNTAKLKPDGYSSFNISATGANADIEAQLSIEAFCFNCKTVDFGRYPHSASFGFTEFALSFNEYPKLKAFRYIGVLGDFSFGGVGDFVSGPPKITHVLDIRRTGFGVGNLNTLYQALNVYALLPEPSGSPDQAHIIAELGNAAVSGAGAAAKAAIAARGWTMA